MFALKRAEALLALGSLALCLAVAEGALRLLRADAPRPTGYAPVNTDRKAARPTNSRGYRDEEHALAKPAGTRRLLVMGDSFAWGASIEFEDTFAQRLQRGLTRRRRERWETINLAIPGLSNADHVAQLPAEGLGYSPDVVILGYVLNDAESKQQMKERERGYAERDSRAPGLLDRSALARFVRARLQASEDASERVRYHRSLYDEGSPGWQATRAGLRTMGALCRERGIPFVVAIFPMFGNPLDDSYPFKDIHAKVAQAAAEGGARVVDLLPAYRGLRWELLVVNGALDEHPNEIAHRIAADTLLRALDDVVAWSPQP